MNQAWDKLRDGRFTVEDFLRQSVHFVEGLDQQLHAWNDNLPDEGEERDLINLANFPMQPQPLPLPPALAAVPAPALAPAPAVNEPPPLEYFPPLRQNPAPVPAPASNEPPPLYYFQLPVNSTVAVVQEPVFEPPTPPPPTRSTVPNNSPSPIPSCPYLTPDSPLIASTSSYLPPNSHSNSFSSIPSSSYLPPHPNSFPSTSFFRTQPDNSSSSYSSSPDNSPNLRPSLPHLPEPEMIEFPDLPMHSPSPTNTPSPLPNIPLPPTPDYLIESEDEDNVYENPIPRVGK